MGYSGSDSPFGADVPAPAAQVSVCPSPTNAIASASACGDTTGALAGYAWSAEGQGQGQRKEGQVPRQTIPVRMSSRFEPRDSSFVRDGIACPRSSVWNDPKTTQIDMIMTQVM